MNLVPQERAPAGVVLVTGGCGYLGSHLIRDLFMCLWPKGITVRILDNLQSGQYEALMDLPGDGEYQFIEGDILDPAAVELALQGVDTVIHLAAVVRTPLSFEHPTWMEQVNHWGTVRLVEACLQAGVSRFIYASSAAVYGPGGPFTEQDICRPIGPYGQSKQQAEQSILAARVRTLDPTILRFGTLCGWAPAMRFDAVANRFAYLAGTGRPLTVFGSGEQVRPLLHIRDACDALRFCLDHRVETAGQVLNVVSENASVLDLVTAVRKSRPAVRVHFAEQDVLTHLSFSLDGSKLERLGWKPRYAIDGGIADVIARFRNITTVGFDTMGVEENG